MKRQLIRAGARVGATSLLTVLLVALPAAAGEGGGLTPYDVAKLQSVTSAVMSPDGTWIAYTVSVPRVPFEEASGPPWSVLYVADLEGHSRPFITGKVRVRGVQWTPDSKGITFLAKRGDDKHQSLYLIPIDGGEARRVARHETSIGSYTLSGDGKHVAFIATDKKDKDAKKLEDKGFDQEVYEEDFRTSRVWITELGNEDAKARPLDLPGYPSDIVWSPVGSQLAVSLAPTPLIDDYYMNRKLHVFDVDDGSIVSSFKNPGKLGRPVWSPDGKYLAFRSAEDIHDPSAGRLFIADPATGTFNDILPDYLGEVGSIAWRDNETVMFFADEGVWTTLKRIGYDGSRPKTLIDAGRYVLGSLSLSRDGMKGAMISSSPMHPNELFTMQHGDDAPRPLTDSNPWLKDIRLARQEVVKHPARDGLELQGILIHPLDEQPGQRYPLIMAVHGGPESHMRNGWVTRYANPGQVAAGRGYAVFMPNYRGSTGRGVAFSKLDQGDYAGKEFDDLVDAVDYLVSIGLVDKDRVGITGGSYGGYATAWCTTYHTKRFAAGVMFAGISDLTSKSSTTDIPEEMYLVHARKRLWDDWDYFAERSPIRYIEQAETPLLIMHGKDDPRVHPSQALELYRNLKLLGHTPVRLVWYPGEGHGNRRSAARLDYNLRTMRWFDHYLKGSDRNPPPYEMKYDFPDEAKEKDADAADESGDD